MYASILTSIGLLADGQAGETGADLFWKTSAGTLIAALLGAAGVVVVLVSLVKGFTFIGQGKPGQAVKIAFGAIALCVFLFRPSTMNDVISTVANVFDGVLSNTEKISKCAEDGVLEANCDVSGGGSNTGSTPGTPTSAAPGTTVVVP